MLTKNLSSFAFGTKVTSRHPPDVEMTIVLRGAYDVAADGTLTLVEDSVDRGSVTGDLFHEDERDNECIHASDFADFKLSAEVLLRGSCHVPDGREVTHCPVEVSVGTWKKALHVFGHRRWKAKVMSKPEPFSTMELCYRNAFGGPGYEPNPVGCGFKNNQLPTIEYPKKPIATPLDRPPPACFGPIHPDWRERTRKMGTQYGEAYLKERAPFYAADFDWRFFSAAPSDQQLKGYLRGDEPVRLINLHPDAGRVDTALPGVRPRAFVKDSHGRFREVVMSLDTVLFELDERRMYLSWRGVDAVEEDDLEDVAFVLYAREPLDAPEPVEHYRRLLDEFEADPIGLVADMDPALLELGQRMEQADSADPYPDAPDQGNPISNLLARKLGPAMPEVQAEVKANIEQARQEAASGLDKAVHAAEDAELPEVGPDAPVAEVPSLAEKIAEQQGAFDAALEDAAAQHLDSPPTPIIPKPGALPDTGLRRTMRGVFAQAAELRERAEAEDTQPAVRRELLAAAADLEKVPHEPGWSELDDEYTPPVEPISEELPGPGRDLSEQDLSGRDLSGMDLSGANLQMTILTKANLAGANLTGANLHRAILYKTNLTGANLTGADLSRVNAGSVHAPKASFQSANLDEAFFERANLEGADLGGAKGSYQAFAHAKLAGAKGFGCALTRADFSHADMSEADFRDTEMTHTAFTECRLQGASFSNAKLRRSSFEKADAAGVDFTGIDAELSIWLGAKLDRADFSYAILNEAHFTKASAVGTKFRCANLAETRFYRVRLDEADIQQANLFQADLCKAQLTDTKFCKSNLYDSKFLGAKGKRTDFTEAIMTMSTLVRK